MRQLIKNPWFILGVLVAIAAILRFYKLNWDEGFFFHPDERNIAWATSNLNLDNGAFNPKFWAYGSLPIYIIYFIAYVITKTGIAELTNFESYILIGRVLSALLSTLMIPLVFVILRALLNSFRQRDFLALLGAFFLTFLPGMIQFAHFTTFEIFLTFQYLLLLMFLMRIVKSGGTLNYSLVGIMLGLTIGTKIVSLAILPTFFIAHLLHYLHNRQGTFLRSLFSPNLLLGLILIPLAAFLASPYHVLDYNGFRNSLTYESGVADGSLPVFYTQQFIQTIPVIYQLTRVFPYVLTLPLTILTIIATIYVSYRLISIFSRVIYSKRRIGLFASEAILVFAITGSYLIFHLVLYVKWTRYMIPVLPFAVIICCIFLAYLFHHLPKLGRIVSLVVAGWIMLAGVSFWQIYTHPDTRTTAATWAKENLSSTSFVTTEIYDMGIVPFNSVFNTNRMQLLPLYDLENDPQKNLVFISRDQSDVFISPSNRLYDTRFRLKDLFPEGFRFYQEILDNPTTWQEVFRVDRQTAECNLATLWCFLGTSPPDETFAVFDHPPVRIFRNQK